MINQEFTEYCYFNIIEIYHDKKSDERKKLIKAFSVLKEFLLKLDEDNNMLFSSFFQRLHYIISKYDIKKSTSTKLYSLRYFSSKLSGDKSIAITEYELELRLCDIFVVIKDISGFDFPPTAPFISDEILREERSKFYAKRQKQKSDKVPHVRLIVNELISADEATKRIELSVKTEANDDSKLIISDFWFAHTNMFSVGTILSIVNAGFDGVAYYTHQYSLLTVEPDFLVDVTDIAECFGGKETNANLYFLSKFSKGSIGEAAVVGNIVNHLFDELALDCEVGFDSALDRALRQKPLQVIALNADGAANVSIRDKAIRQFHNLKNTIPSLPIGKRYLEPSFISIEYGLQGRLDMLIEDKKKKFVVELKSGKAPTTDLYYKDADDKTYHLSIWKNHTIQAIAYIMLLDSQSDGASVTSSILYSSAEKSRLRNVPNIIRMKKEILKVRNYIVAVEKALAKGNYSIFKKFNQDDFGYYPTYKHNIIDEFRLTYKGMTNVELDYFHSFIGLLSREYYIGKLGTGDINRGFSSLWLESDQEKTDSFVLLRYLELLPNESDFEHKHIKFSIRNSEIITNLRQGDIVIVYHIPKIGNTDVTKHRLLKGSIKILEAEYLVISFRNKLEPFDFPDTYEWAIEADHIDSLSKMLFSSLYALFCASKRKRAILLGLSEPQKRNIYKVFYPELNENQLNILYQALSSDNYYLVQGPPGTGKTSYLLRYLAIYLFEHTDENVLLLAYTNRAADEICASLLRISNDFPFLRLGGKDSSAYKDKLISTIAEDSDLEGLNVKISQTRFFVSTVASVLSTAEIFKVKEFHTAIIDEAGQISEPYLMSTLTHVERFILIGDEKQLPAVITQPQQMLKVDSEPLSEIGLRSLGMSYFERMLSIAKSNGWNEHFGMLTHQARMNESIMRLANELFYAGELNLLPKSIKSESFLPNDHLLSADIIFIDTPTDDLSKVNRFEAKIACAVAGELLKFYENDTAKDSIGIVAPFRAQVAEIIKCLDKGIKKQIAVDTVERFQGSERDVIITCFTANHEFDLAKISNTVVIDGIEIDRKLNVTITRAKNKLILIGNSSILKKSHIHRKMIEFVEAKFTFTNYSDFFREYPNFSAG